MALQTALTALLFIGTYTRDEGFVDGRGKGVYTLILNKTDGTLSNLELYTDGGVNPSYLTLSQSGKYLYVVNENEDYVTSDGRNKSGQVLAFYVNPKANRKLTLLNKQVTEGTLPCHVRTDKTDSVVYVSNYGSGNVAIFQSQINDGTLEKAADVKFNLEGGSGVVVGRQETPHYHCMIESPNNQFVFEADLGADKIMQYRLDTKTGKLTENGFMSTAAGSGPRQLTFHPTLNFVYILNELGNTITVASYNEATGRLTSIQTVPSLPNDFIGVSSGADIHISTNGKFLYASNRGHDSIVIYAIDMVTGLLSNQPIDFVSTEGAIPRNFVIHGDILLVANQNSDSIVSFRMNAETGKLTKLSQITVPTPVCLKLLDLIDSTSSSNIIQPKKMGFYAIVSAGLLFNYILFYF